MELGPLTDIISVLTCLIPFKLEHLMHQRLLISLAGLLNEFTSYGISSHAFKLICNRLLLVILGGKSSLGCSVTDGTPNVFYSCFCCFSIIQ